MRYLLLLILFSIAFLSSANDIDVKNVTYDSKSKTVRFDLIWKNGWKNKKNHDAAWVFVKFPELNGYQHGLLSAGGHKVSNTSGVKGELILPGDRVGVFIEPSKIHRGDGYGGVGRLWHGYKICFFLNTCRFLYI